MEGRDVEKGQRDDSGGCRRRGRTRVVRFNDVMDGGRDGGRLRGEDRSQREMVVGGGGR